MPSAGHSSVHPGSPGGQNGTARARSRRIVSADIAVGDAEPVRVTVENTRSPDDHWTVSVPVEPKDGADKVTFGNATAWAPRTGRIEPGRVVGLL
ncbi:hypothetical protein [Streptomyces sp. bgisy034]|uniref:hypothetical protein n=1 Tax=Streptomyces sp. bgisy034 TaxID=3413774 RepID=UPI003EBF2759